MNVAIDFDGTITANWSFYTQLISDLSNSYHTVYIITGANHNRVSKIYTMLNDMKIKYDYFITRPEEFKSTPRNIGNWKKEQMRKYKIKIWWDNEIKQYEQAGVDFSDLKTAIVRV